MCDALYLLDGYSLVYRSYFAFIRNPLVNPKGRNASAIFGFFRSLFLLLDDRTPSHFAVVLDSRTPTFRHQKYEEYKTTREKTPEDLKNEIPVIEEILDKLGVPTVRVDGYEADDVMATLALRAKVEERFCYVVSGDKDLLQLVDGPVTVLKPESGGGFTELDRDGVVETWGVTPEQILDYLALVGDSSDNVPGVKGIGAKTAAKLLGEYATLDEIYDHLDEISSKSQREKLADGRDLAFLSRDLVRLETDVPLERGIDDFRLGELDREAAAPYFAAEGMRSLVKEMIGRESIDLPEDDPRMRRAVLVASREMASWLDDANATLDPSGATDEKADEAGRGEGAGRRDTRTGSGPGAGEAGSTAVERPALMSWERDPADGERGRYELVDTLEALERWCETARSAGIVAFDCETTSLDAMTAQPIGFSFATESGKACYVALHGPHGPVLPTDECRSRIGTLLEDPAVRVVGQNLKYDYKVVARWGVRIANPWFDTMIAAWLLDTESNRLGMDALAEDYLGYSTLHYADVVPKAARGEPENTFDVVPLDRATAYAAEDADITLRLSRVLARLLDEHGMTTLFHEIEMPLLPILAEMELEGIRLDTAELAKYSVELESELADIEQEIYSLVGHEFNIGSTKQLQQVLFEERKLTPGKKTKTGYSTDVSVLQDLAREDPVPALVLRNRTLSKLKSTYVDSLPEMVKPDTGRIHTHFNINGTATGRISSTDPNLQNIPIRDEEGRRIRSAFVPRDGWRFVSADYSQIELVVLAHLSDDPGLKKAFAEGVDVHRHTGSLIFGVEPDDVTAAQRRIAKTINFGVMYGMSTFRLARDLQISRREAEAFIEAYFTTYSRIKSFIDETVARAEERGYVETILGRRRYLANISNRNRTVKMASERIAVNTPIQGSAADIIKKAMIDLSAVLRERSLESRLLLQVHDELILECPVAEVEEVGELVKEVMADAVELSIPLKVSVETGSSWGEMH
ncbi:MAG: DNA polymerase I [Spirochaetota bacterium]